MTELSIFAKPQAEVRPMEPDADAKHLAMLQAIAPFAKDRVQKGVTEVDIIPATKNTKFLLILMPEWATMFPPFNLARLSAVSTNAGYATKCLDINIKSYNHMRQNNHFDLGYNPWDGTREWKWLAPHYQEDLHEKLEPIFESFVQEIVDFNPDVIGFTTYYCNYEPTSWMASRLKEVLPNAVFVLGGREPLEPILDYKIRYEKNYHMLVNYYKNIIMLQDFCKSNDITLHWVSCHDDISRNSKPEPEYENDICLNNFIEYADLDFIVSMEEVAERLHYDVYCPGGHFSEKVHEEVASIIANIIKEKYDV